MNIIERIETVLPELSKRFPMIEVVYLFGSRASKAAGEASDLDLALFVDQVHYPLDPLLDLKVGLFFQERLGLETDVVILNRVSPILQHEVLKTGKRLYEKDGQQRARLELVAFKSYVDAKYYQDLRKRKGLVRGQ